MRLFTRRSLLLVGTAVSLFSIMNCNNYRHYQWRTGSVTDNNSDNYSIHFIEADDEGWFWDKGQVDDAMDVIRGNLAKDDTIVVTFVHGWHHSAQCCDSNVEGFRNTLLQLRKMLNPKIKLVGLYVGWRGRSLPGFFDYTTFWGRKGAAERIGQNDFKEFMARLQDLFVEYRPDAARTPQSAEAAGAANQNRHFLGLVTIGHSFGAQVIMRAVAGPLEDQLQRLNKTPAYLRGAEPGTPTADQSFTLSGIGDLIVLINPALEASQYHRLHVLSRGLRYSNYQTPLILTISAENDNARHRFFIIGRVLGEFFTGKPDKQDEVQRTVEREALGVFKSHITHLLEPTEPKVELVTETIDGDRRQCSGQRSCKSEWRGWLIDPYKMSPPGVTEPDSLELRNPCAIRAFDFSGNVVFSNVKLRSLNSEDIADPNAGLTGYTPGIPFQPLIVARASKQIVDNHGGIFTQPFMNFLVSYIRFIEQKSLINVRGKTEQRKIEQKRLESAPSGRLQR